MSNSDDNYVGVLLEQIRDEIKAVHEEVGGMREELANVPKREEFNELKDDMKVVKAAVTDISHQANDHDHRITRLEAKAA